MRKLRKWTLAVGLLAVARAVPLAGQELRPLYLFTRAETGDTSRHWLVEKTSVRILKVEPAPDSFGRTVTETEVAGLLERRGEEALQDSVRADSGKTHQEYERVVNGGRDRYLVLARTPDGKIFWSVDLKSPTAPRFHTLDNLAMIRMAEVPARIRDVASGLFPQLKPEAAADSGKMVPPAPDPPSKPGFFLTFLFILAGLVGLGAVGYLAWWGIGFWRDSRPLVVSSGPATPTRPVVPTGEANAPYGDAIRTGWSSSPRVPAPDGPEKLASQVWVAERLAALESSLLAEIDKKLKSLEGVIKGKLEEIEGRLPRKPPPREERVQPGDAPAASGGDVTRQVASVFVEWCRSAGGNINRIKDFTEFMRARISGADVQVLSRDRNSLRIIFVSDGAGDPVEYWSVTVARGTMLLPRPLNTQRFKELQPVFTGEADPLSLRYIEPALVRQEGSGWGLEKKGQING